MKRPLLILPIFMLLAPSASPQYVLRLEARPLDRIPETEGSVWNLSDAEYTKGNNPDYVIYGDSLFSETVECIRRWYALSPDTVRFIREESMRHSFEPYGSVPTAATGMAGMESHIDTVHGEGFS